MVNFLAVTCILAGMLVMAVDGQSPAPSEAPVPATADCSTLIYNMMDCMTFLDKGSTDTKPEGTCCSGLKTVLNTDADCVCYALSSTASLGIAINMTKAAALPSACGVSAPPLSNCNLTSTPTASPPANPPAASAAPSSSPSVPPTTETPAAASGGEATTPSAAPSGPAAHLAPAPSPSGAYTIPVISASVVFAVTVISFSISNA